MRGLSIIKTYLSKYLSLLIPSGFTAVIIFLISSKFFPVNICPDQIRTNDSQRRHVVILQILNSSLYAISPLLRAERAGHRLQLKNPAKNRYSCSLLGFIRSNIVFAISYKVKQLFICIYLVCALSFVF